LNCNSDLKITSLIFRSPNLNLLDYHVWGVILGCYTRQNQPTLPRTALLFVWSDLPLEFIDKAIPCDFERDFDRVLLQLADTLNTQFKYRDDSWHLLL